MGGDMARKLEQKRAVITGASSGIGRAIARAFGAAGAGVALVARDAEGLEGAAFEVRSSGGSAMTFVADVADAGALELVADQVAAEWGGIDIWVNDAMVSVFAPVDEITPAEYRRVMEVNYLGYVYGTRAALKHMRLQAGGGVILQIGSAVAYRSIPLQSAYAASKAAIRAFTDSLRSELIHERSKVKLCHLQLPAVNTPQFDVVRNKLGDHPHPVPPVYQPEIIAAAAVKAALRPRREIWIGASTVEAIIGQRLFPGFLDRYLARKAWDAQKTRRLPPGHPFHHPDNLDGPVPGDKGAHGPFDAEARSPQRERRLRAARLAALGAVAAALLGLLLRRAAA
jgi:short-subunit dehydrogenase